MKTLLFFLLIAAAAFGQDTSTVKPMYWKEVDTRGRVWYNYRFSPEQQAKVAEKEKMRQQCQMESESCEGALQSCHEENTQWMVVVDGLTSEIAQQRVLMARDSVDLNRSQDAITLQAGINKALKKERNRYRAGMYCGFVGGILSTVAAYLVTRKQ